MHDVHANGVQKLWLARCSYILVPGDSIQCCLVLACRLATVYVLACVRGGVHMCAARSKYWRLQMF